jgi:hypothetical protein
MVGAMVGVPVEAVAGLVVVGAEGLAWGGPRAQAGVAVLVPLALSPSYRVPAPSPMWQTFPWGSAGYGYPPGVQKIQSRDQRKSVEFLCGEL